MESKEALSDVRRERYDSIREQIKKPSLPRYIYLLLEPDADVIRYVGVCVDPVARFGAHTGDQKDKKVTPVRKWILDLKDRGVLPRMLLVGKVGGIGYWCEQEIATTCLAETIEQEIIYRLINRRWVGNTDMTNDLLNVAITKRRTTAT